MTNNHIILENLKGIKYLDFEIPPPGVHVVTASNGSGKTTLMHCIERIVNNSVFRDNFTQHGSWNVDSYEKSRITYRSNLGREVTYTYRSGSDSWRPIAQTAATLTDFKYEQIVTIPTLGTRVYIQNKTIKGGFVKAAQNELRGAMERVLGNEKYKKLLKINLGETRGRGGGKRRENIAFLLPKGVESKLGKQTQTYYSESSFSLGEIFTLNLLFQLGTIPDNSLLVIDELEVALHPRVQVNILNYLEEKSREKNLTIIISTHSSTLIKCARSLIMLRNNGDGEIQALYNCYPALALQEVSVEEDMQPDYVFFVEDTAARLYLKEKIRLYFSIVVDRPQPIWKILPVGGFREVLNFLKESNRYLLQRRIGQYAFLDHDVLATKNDLIAAGKNRTEGESRLLELFTSQENRIKFLSITPELGLWKWLNDNPGQCQIAINGEFQDSPLNVTNLLAECEIAIPNAANNERAEAKTKTKWLYQQISEISNIDVVRIQQILFSIYAFQKYSARPDQLRGLLGPIFGRQGNP